MDSQGVVHFCLLDLAMQGVSHVFVPKHHFPMVRINVDSSMTLGFSNCVRCLNCLVVA